MDESILHHIMYRLANAPIHSYPYPHFFIKEIFPAHYYQEILDHLPDTAYYQSLATSGIVSSGTYKERFILPLKDEALSQLPFDRCVFWNAFIEGLNSSLWIDMLLEHFGHYIKKRFGSHYDKVQFSSVAELLRDKTNYSIGPHTDHPVRVLTILFYLPSNQEQIHFGTSVYRPRNPSFECEGFSHHPFAHFVNVQTAPFYPNSAFGFIKSERSFHGVEPIQEEHIERNLLNYYLQWNPKSHL